MIKLCPGNVRFLRYRSKAGRTDRKRARAAARSSPYAVRASAGDAGCAGVNGARGDTAQRLAFFASKNLP
jgi:hypothetical protein